MGKTLVVTYSETLSIDIRTNRVIKVRLASHDGLGVESVLVVSANGIPVWVAEVDRFEIQRGGLQEPVAIHLGRLAHVEGCWMDIAPDLGHVDLQGGKLVSIDVQKMIQLGSVVEHPQKPLGGALLPLEARARLAWTYGVTEDRVKITIDF